VVAVNPAGIVIGIAGLWVTFQVLGGNALYRLKILEGEKLSGYIRKLPPQGQSTTPAGGSTNGTPLGTALGKYL
jgi:hypothetical protein